MHLCLSSRDANLRHGALLLQFHRNRSAAAGTIYELKVKLADYCSSAADALGVLADMETPRFATIAENRAWLAQAAAPGEKMAHCLHPSPCSVYASADPRCRGDDLLNSEEQYRTLGGR